MARLLALPDPPTAVFAGGSTLALGAMAEARSRGLQVPRDLAIVGYTDSPLATLVDPPLTMVEVPAHEIGLRAMRTLSDLIQGKEPRRQRTVLSHPAHRARQLRLARARQAELGERATS